VLGIAIVLWADEGFGVRAVEALHAGWSVPPAVRLMGRRHTGAGLFKTSPARSHVLVFDAVDCGLPGGTLKVLRAPEVPAWGAPAACRRTRTVSTTVLGLAQLGGRDPSTSPPSACNR